MRLSKTLHASGEDYLETILVLQKKLGMVRSVDVARPLVQVQPEELFFETCLNLLQ